MKQRMVSKTRAVAEKRSDGIFPGDLGNPERENNYHAIDEYNNDASEFKEGWDTPVKTKIEDKRDEMNLGIPKTAAKFVAAKKAVILAEMCLGTATPRKYIRAQASQFMKLGYAGICQAIARFEKTAAFNKAAVKAAETAPAAPAPADSAPAAPVADKDEDATCPGGVCPSCGTPVAKKADDAETLPPAAPVPAPVAAPAPESVDEIEADDKDELPIPTAPAAAPACAAPVAEDVSPAPQIGDIDIPAAPEAAEDGVLTGDGELQSSDPDPELEKMFSGAETPAPAPAAACRATAKQGIKHLSGQPRLASADTSSVSDLAGIWDGLKFPHL